MAWQEFNKIVYQLAEDLKIDRLNMDQKTLRMPSIKHFWIAKLYNTKIRILTLEKKKKELYKSFAQSGKVMQIGLSKDAILKQFNSSEIVKKINDQIEQLGIIVAYLQDAKFVLGRATDDLKNRIQLEKVQKL